MLPEDHELYSMYGRSFLNVTLSNFIHHLKEFKLCIGIALPDSSKELNCQKHVIPKQFNYNDYQLMEFKHICVKMNIIVQTLVKYQLNLKIHVPIVFHQLKICL